MSGANQVTGDGTAASPLTPLEENYFHDADLRTNHYTLGTAAHQTWQPRFSHWGFRYLEVRNLEAALGRAPDPRRDARAFRVDVARSGFARTGAFTTDNALLNRVRRNLEWAEQNNLVQKPTNTPSREKNGWTGDTMAGSASQSLTWDVHAAFTKYLRGFPDGQISTGQLPVILPAAKGGYGYDRTPGWDFTWKAVPAWDSAYFVIPRELHRYYGARTLYAELYEHQVALLAYYETLFTEENGYRFSAPLGAYQRERHGRRLRPRARLRPARRPPVPPPGTRTRAGNEKALAKLLADRVIAAGHHLQSDMYGSRYEFNILSDHGYTDAALKAVTQTGTPGDTGLSPATLDHVAASIDTVRGTVASRWRRRGDGRRALPGLPRHRGHVPLQRLAVITKVSVGR